jgi:hypothetical protein
MIDLIPVPSGVAADAVDHAAADIERAIRRGGDFDLDDVRRKVAARDWQLWVPTIDGRAMGVIITHVSQRPRAKVAEIVLLAGRNAKTWMPRAEEMIAAWARELGCVALEAAGRSGWERRMSPCGWQRQAIVIRKELADA